ncbi:TonB-dependent receptor domain-containing protein [Paludibaculum fermentans]|uniref:TonB-dependent receptor n=1 Tax=Paludibaculum fermentans TaxID=1473598 RepID=UPI003EBBF8EA
MRSIFVAALFPVCMLAQMAELNGRITDESGASVPEASVRITNSDTGLERHTVTNERGIYSVPNLVPGPYQLSINKDGFRPITRSGVTLAVRQTAAIDFTLTVGGVTEHVEVTAEAPLLETARTSVGHVIENRKINELPLVGRRFLEFALMGAGVNQGRPGDVRASQQGVAISANGLYTKNNNFMLDGADNNESYQNQFGVSPSVDAIAEFKVETGLYSAEFGRGGGAMVSVVTKSGTNDFHGVLFEFLRNDVLDARNYFASSSERKPPLRRNQFGGSIGGPIRRNRAFFFANYDGTRLRSNGTSTSVVPNEAQRSGDLSSFKAVIDPLTRAPFPGNLIPADRVSPVSRKLLAYWPLPNATDPARNYVSFPRTVNDLDNALGRVDLAMTNADTVYVRFAINRNPYTSAGTAPLAGGRRSEDTAHGAVLNWTRVVSPKALNSASVSYNRFLQDSFGQNNGQPLAAGAGVTGISTNPRDVGFVESIGFSAGTGFLSLGEAAVRIRHVTTYNASDTFSWMTGGHSIKVGGEFRNAQVNVFQTAGTQGQFTFNGQYTGGNGFAEFLLGIPSSSSTSVTGGLLYPRRRAMAAFVQDDWKASSRLTLNLGLRYELNSSPNDKRNQLSSFDHTTGTLMFPQDSELGDFFQRVRPDLKIGRLSGNTLYDTDSNNFAPRVGLAYRLTNKTVWRSAFGVYFLSPELNSEGNTGNSPPFQLRVDQVGNQGTPNLSWNLPGDPILLRNAEFGIFTFNADRAFRLGYITQWMGEIQHELGRGWVVRTGYVANKGTALDTHLVRNQREPGAGTASSRRLFAGFARIRSYESNGWSRYNSWQTTVEKRMARGLSVLGTYTWAKVTDFGWTQDICCQQDINNLAAEKALASHDQRHRFTTNVLYDLPFGGDSRGVLKKVIAGWRSGALLTIASGFPGNPTVSGNPDNVPDNTDRPNRIGDGSVSNPSPNKWWDVTAFQKQAPFTFGNSGRNVLTGPGSFNIDFIVSKDTTIGESKRLEFRSEFFNLTNTPNFGQPSADISNANFGRITSARSARQMQMGLKLYF